MPGSDCLFDTNAFIAWSREDYALAARVVGIVIPTLSVVSFAELIFGAKNSSRPQRNLEDLYRRSNVFRILCPDLETAVFYGDVASVLRRKGRPIPTNDVWIAAIALQHGLPLLTRDAHFNEVDGLSVVTW